MAVMTNYVHILLRSSEMGLSDFMRRLLTSFAVLYNRRHRRWGYLYHNRYESIVCQAKDLPFEEIQLFHRTYGLHPFESVVVKNSAQLDRYR